ncbi:MAG: hypothetical protein V4472_17645 [Pseudomonadota bacterium]
MNGRLTLSARSPGDNMAKFDTAPKALYTIDELFSGFDPARPETYKTAPDFEIYLEFVTDGGAASTNKPNVLARAEHDCTIMQLLADELHRDGVVAMMGGHAVQRGTKPYDDTAKAAFALTNLGKLVITGGGPGAMEAAHLGAAVAEGGGDLDAALAHMAKGPPDTNGMPITIDPTKPHPIVVDDQVVADLTAYYARGWELKAKYPKGGGVAIPTWMYGWEPTCVFAAKVGKYFQNSIREDGLLAAATDGIIYSQGSAGTLQEVFQDAAQNYYKSFPAPAEAKKGRFSPMVFLGDYWTVDDMNDAGRKTLPVKRLLDKLWLSSRDPSEGARLVTFATTPDDAVRAIQSQPGLKVAPAIAIAKATSSG